MLTCGCLPEQEKSPSDALGDSALLSLPTPCPQPHQHCSWLSSAGLLGWTRTFNTKKGSHFSSTVQSALGYLKG